MKHEYKLQVEKSLIDALRKKFQDVDAINDDQIEEHHKWMFEAGLESGILKEVVTDWGHQYTSWFLTELGKKVVFGTDFKLIN